MVLKYSDRPAAPIGSRPRAKRVELRDLEARIYQTPVLITRPVGRAAQTRAAGSLNREHLAPDAAASSATLGPTETNAELKPVCGQNIDSPMTWLGATLKTVTGASGEHRQIMNTGLRLNLSEERMESMITGLVAVCENLPGEDEMHYLAHALLYNMQEELRGRRADDRRASAPCYWYTEPPRPRRPRIVG